MEYISDDDDNDDEDDVYPEPAPSHRREGGRQVKAVKYTFDDDNDDDDIDDVPGSSGNRPLPQQIKQRKKIESDEEFELSS